MGGVNTVATYLIYLAALFIFPYGIAYGISYVSGIVISYMLNSIFVFKQPMKLSIFLKYPAVYLIQFLLGIILLTFFIELSGMNEKVAPLVVILIMIPVTYVLSKKIILGSIK